MLSGNTYKPNKKRGIILIIAAVCLDIVFMHTKLHINPSQTALYVHTQLQYAYTRIATLAITTSIPSPHHILSWVSEPSSSPFPSPTASFASSIPSITPDHVYTLHLAVNASLTGDILTLKIHLSDTQNLPVANAHGYLSIKGIRTDIGLTDANGNTSATLPITQKSTITVTEIARTSQISSSLAVL